MVIEARACESRSLRDRFGKFKVTPVKKNPMSAFKKK
jgi:hypothetical protein